MAGQGAVELANVLLGGLKLAAQANDQGSYHHHFGGQFNVACLPDDRWAIADNYFSAAPDSPAPQSGSAALGHANALTLAADR
jgi:hypothetical protein